MGKHRKADDNDDNADNVDTRKSTSAADALRMLQQNNAETGTKICGIHGPYAARHGSCPNC